MSAKNNSPGVNQMRESLRVMGMDIVNSLLVTLANCSKTAVWVFGSLLAADLAALCVYVHRSGNADEEEGHVVTDGGPLAGPSVAGDDVLVGGKYAAKQKVLASRSLFVSDMALVDGSATKNQRLLVRGIQLAFLLFWLTFVFGALTLLASDPAFALTVTVIMSCGLYCGVTAIRRGRANALRELAEERAAARGNRQSPPPV